MSGRQGNEHRLLGNRISNLGRWTTRERNISCRMESICVVSQSGLTSSLRHTWWYLDSTRFLRVSLKDICLEGSTWDREVSASWSLGKSPSEQWSGRRKTTCEFPNRDDGLRLFSENGVAVNVNQRAAVAESLF